MSDNETQPKRIVDLDAMPWLRSRSRANHPLAAWLADIYALTWSERIVLALMLITAVGWLAVAFAAFQVLACHSGWSSCIHV